jgi:hypothetical protein
MVWRQGERSRRNGAHRGQSMVELALMLPLITLILIGAVDLGRAFFYYTRLTSSVSAGAHYGLTAAWAVDPTDCKPVPTYGPCDDPNNIKFRVQNEGNLGLDDSNITVTCYQGRTTTLVAFSNPNISPPTSRPGDCRGAKSGDTIEVTARYAFRPLTTQLLGFLPSSFQLRKSVRMVLL